MASGRCLDGLVGSRVGGGCGGVGGAGGRVRGGGGAVLRRRRRVCRAAAMKSGSKGTFCHCAAQLPATVNCEQGSRGSSLEVTGSAPLPMCGSRTPGWRVGRRGGAIAGAGGAVARAGRRIPGAAEQGRGQPGASAAAGPCSAQLCCTARARQSAGQRRSAAAGPQQGKAGALTRWGCTPGWLGCTPGWWGCSQARWGCGAGRRTASQDGRTHPIAMAATTASEPRQ